MSVTVELKLFEAKTELQLELVKRLQGLSREYDDIHDKQEALELDADRIVDDISTLRAALEVEGRRSGQIIKESPGTNGKDKFIGMGLRDAVGLFRSEQPNITKEHIKQRLLEVGFNFKGKKPGNAIHMAWISLDRVNK